MIAGKLSGGESLVVAQIEVGFRTVVGDVHLAVLVRTHRAGIDIQVGIALLQGNPEPATLQQAAYRRRCHAFSKGRNYAARYKNIFRALGQSQCTYPQEEKPYIALSWELARVSNQDFDVPNRTICLASPLPALTPLSFSGASLFAAFREGGRLEWSQRAALWTPRSSLAMKNHSLSFCDCNIFSTRATSPRTSTLTAWYSAVSTTETTKPFSNHHNCSSCSRCSSSPGGKVGKSSSASRRKAYSPMCFQCSAATGSLASRTHGIGAREK